MRWTRAKSTGLADSLDRAAADKLSAASSGDAFASNPDNSDLPRQQAAAAAEILRGQARDMQADADAIRDGVSPTELGYTN